MTFFLNVFILMPYFYSIEFFNKQNSTICITFRRFPIPIHKTHYFHS